jgi:hypothetical protein
MSDVTGVGSAPPTPPSGGSSTPPSYSSGTPDSGSGGFKAFKEFFGEKDYAQFQAGLCKSIAAQIGHDQKKAKEASDQLKRSTTGEDLEQP